jgi:hypothetical protein
MIDFRSLLAVTAFAFAAMSAPVRAEGPAMRAYVLIIHPTGMTTIGEVNADAAGAAIAQSKQLNEPVVLMLSNGKAYLGGKSDTTMPDGRSMMDFISSNFCSDAKHPGGCG